MRESSAPVLVLGVGNILLRDDGVGVYLARELARHHWPGQVEVVDGGTLGLGLLPLLDGRQVVVVLDATRSPEPVGTLRWLAWPGDFSANTVTFLSVHEGGAWPLLLAAQLTDTLPGKVWLGAVTVATMETGLGLSEALSSCWPGLVKEATSFVELLAEAVQEGGQRSIQSGRQV